MPLVEFTQQPWKALFLGYQLGAILLQLPLWTLRYMFPFMRPYPSWSLGHTIAVQLVGRIAYISSMTGGIVGLPDHLAIVPSRVAEGVWVEGIPHLVIAELEIWASVSKVEPERIPGYWYAKKGKPSVPSTPNHPGQRVFFFLHGGGYIQLSAHPRGEMTSNIIRALIDLDDSVTHAFALEYRLSSTSPHPDRNPFPAALLDALAGYNYLVDVMGYAPSDIIVGGNSAGGNLALALTQYLVRHSDAKASLPSPPGSLLLLSPWTDLSTSHDWPGSSTLTNTADYLAFHHAGRSLYSKYAFLGPYGLGFAFYNPYISPASLFPSDDQARFKGFPRTFIAVGTAERMYDPTRTLRKKMAADMGEGQITYFEGKDAIHDFLIYKWHPCRPVALKAIQRWLTAP